MLTSGAEGGAPVRPRRAEPSTADPCSEQRQAGGAGAAGTRHCAVPQSPPLSPFGWHFKQPWSMVAAAFRVDW